MAPARPLDADSDSDSDAGSEASVTDVQLGLSDGPIDSDDASNPLVSRIGGRPAWLPTKTLPPASVATCKHCNNTMELLVQIFAPLDGSAYDRVLFVWGCARGVCQRQAHGSIRAVRLLQHNARWAAKLEKQKARKEAAAARRRTQEAAAKAREEEEAARKKVNPFSAGAGAAGTGLGGMLFGAPAPAAAAPQETTVVADAEQDDSESESDEEESRLAEELAVKASLEATQRTADWAAAAAHYAPAQYLNTVPEPSSSARRAASAKLTPAAKAALKAGDGTVPNDDAGLKEWEGESYQRMMVSGVDEAFERFVARVGSEGRQVVRYELGGVPLPFCGSGIVYDKLWPQASRNATPVSRQAMAASDKNGRTYTPSAVPPCEACGGPRTFEVQLMPNLVNLLRPTSIAGAADEAVVLDSNASAEERRRREIESALGRKLPSQPDADGITRAKPQNEQQRLAEEAALRARTGLAWSTALVYTCEQDCCLPREAAAEGEAWREEWVGAQWEE